MTEADMVRADVLLKSLPLWSLGEALPAMLTAPERMLLFSLVYALRPRRCLEIGTAQGGSAAIICKALNYVGGTGSLVCVDESGWEGVSPDLLPTLTRRTSVVRGRSPQCLPPGPFDFAFVDGDHSYTGVRDDLAALRERVTPGGAVLLHDALHPETANAIWDAWGFYGWKDGGLISTEPHFQDGQIWGGLHLLRR